MNKLQLLPALSISLLSWQVGFTAPCPFDAGKSCSLVTDLIRDKSSSGLNYYAATNYDHRMSGEENVYDVAFVKKEANGSITLLADRVNAGFWRSGEIMTRANLTSPPYNSPTPSSEWTTKATTHGYLEVRITLPTCTKSADNLCQQGRNPAQYNQGLWPAIWMMPTYDLNWPQNGEIDIMEAYPRATAFDITTAALHFNGNDPRCLGGDCRGPGLILEQHRFPELAYLKPHTWGFEWQKDPKSTNGGYIMTGYIDNAKVWGPMTTDSLPADGANALRRGFNDPAGGYYLIVNLAVGGPYAGELNAQTQAAAMSIQDIKFYAVSTNPTPPPGECTAPTGITSSYSSDKKNIILDWQRGGDGVQSYQVKDWQKRVLWQGQALTWTDKTLPGNAGKFTYFLTSVCQSKTSADVQYDVLIPQINQCNLPNNIKANYTADKRNITLSWAKPSSGLTVSEYQVRDWLRRVIWQGNQLTWTDKSLPGTAGTFTYFINAQCSTQNSDMVQQDVTIP